MRAHRTSEPYRRHGISANTCYRWRKKHGGMDVSGARRLRQLEDENARRKRVGADQALKLHVSKDLLGSESRRQASGGESSESFRPHTASRGVAPFASPAFRAPPRVTEA